MRPVILIPARLASTRLPEKPLADIAGAPMIVHVLKRASQADIGPVYVACDDARIRDAVQDAGGKAILTRADHPSGSDRIYEALCTIDPQKKFDCVVNVQGDVPTIEPETIRAALAPLANNKVDIATLACEITLAHERSDPAVVKVVLASASPSYQGEGGVGVRPERVRKQETPALMLPVKEGEGNIARALYFSRASIPHGDGTLYHHIGIYAYRREALERFVSLPPSPLELREKLEQLRALEAGMRIDAAIVNAVPLGVDTPEHLERARKVLGAW